MSEAFRVKAYHKAGRENAKRSLTWQSFYVSERSDLWLGNGIYFWENYSDACWWKGKNYIDPLILSAVLSCPMESFLDLDNQLQKEKFIQFVSAAMEQAAKMGYEIKADSSELIAGGSCNYYKSLFGTKLIRYSFPRTSGRPQFCATDTTVASDVRLVAYEQNGVIKEVRNEYF